MVYDGRVALCAKTEEPAFEGDERVVQEGDAGGDEAVMDVQG